MVGELGHNGEVVGDVDGRRAFLLDDLLEGLEDLDLGGHIERGGRLVENQKIRLAAQGHRRHQPLQLATRYLMRIAPADAVGLGQLQGMIELDRPLIGLSLREHPVQNRGFGHLLADLECRIEGRRRALGEVGDTMTEQTQHIPRFHGQDVFAVQSNFAAGELQARLAIGEGSQGNGRLSRTGLADERNHFTRLDVETHALDDGNGAAVIFAGFDLQVADFEQFRH